MKNYIIVPIKFKNGIQRDGTAYNSQSCINGQWVRFYEGAARKMGGYKVTDSGNTEIIRTLFVVPRTGSIDLYLGRPSSLSYLNISVSGAAGVEIDRTPTSGFTSNPNNVWTIDLFTNSENGIITSFIVAQVAPNGVDISNTTEGPLYYGGINDNIPLVPILDENNDPVVASGGIVFSSPVMVAYGNDGVIRWCEEGDITNWPALNSSNAKFLVVANTKIVKAYRNRGGNSPSLLLWSLNSLSRATYGTIGSQNTFTSTTIEDDISIMSSNCIIKYNQMFFWIGVDQFYFFNGIVQKLENTMNNDWFFQNVNLSQRQKIWGVAMPRFKEIWWFYPRGNSLECNAAIIYNLEEQIWYDTLIDRSAGVSTSIYPYPLFAGSASIRLITQTGPVQVYPIWTHEFGTNRVEGTNEFAIDSYYETNQIDLWSQNPQESAYLRNRRIAPDFVQVGTMYATINTQKYPNSPIVSEGPFPFTNSTEKIDYSSQGGIVSFLFRSNEVNGFYQSGKSLYFLEKGDTFK